MMTQFHFKRCSALLAFVCCLNLGHLSSCIDLVRGADGQRGEADQYLDGYLTNLPNTLELRAGADLSEQIDAMADRLNRDLARDPALLRSMSDVLHMREISQAEPADAAAELQAPRRRKRSLVDLLGGRPSASSGSRNRHIVHAQRKADTKQLLALAKNDFVRLSSFAQNDCLRAAAELGAAETHAAPQPNQSQAGLVRRSARALARVVLAVANYGLALFDYIYASPEFLERIPLVRAQVSHLREKGEPLYRIIELVRHTSTYLKLMHANPSRGQSAVTGAGRDEGENDTDGDAQQQVVSMSEADRQRRMRELKKLISNAGVQAVKSIGRRLVEYSLSNMRAESSLPIGGEADARVFYLLVTSVLAQHKQK